jgi:kumamolisin
MLLQTKSQCYPSSSPNAISIGGTKLTLKSDSTRNTETDDNRDPSFGSTWGGGGGVSTVFTLPTWQNNLHYTPITDGVMGTPQPLTMRGLPDISAPMNVYALYFGGGTYGFGGTSLSCPVMVGMLARIQQLTGRQRSSDEYNQVFYSNPTTFYDIVVGTNNTTSTSGYAGTVDWDPVTGLGPPKWQDLYTVMRKGHVFPKENYSFRQKTGVLYPRISARPNK